tara:strand:+ start:311 stop:1213 length:903 start_codon:yes stop_codon:yes gene_type:complete
MNYEELEHLGRPCVPAMDDRLGLPFPVLDHGFVRLIDYMGDQAAIVQAARVSYGTGTKTVSEDRGLIRYLLSHRHTTPFEMCEIKLHVKLPIFVARQWIRHRTANVNEYSARYSILDREFYIPRVQDIAKQSQTNHQGRDEGVDDLSAEEIRAILLNDSNRAYDSYEEMVDEDGYGLARELARINLPTNIYTQWYWKVDLHNLLHFLSLRADPHAQMEIRVYADAICEMVKLWVPDVWEAFEDYRMKAASFSRMELEAVRFLIEKACTGTAPNFLKDFVGLTDLTKREKDAFLAKLEGTP